MVQSSRYDFIADINNNLYKIQVKTSTISEDNSYISFATSTSHTNSQGTKNISYNSKDVDFFATYYDNKCYLIPFNLCAKRTQRLRFLPTKNGQTKNILFAKEFELDNML